MRKVIVVIASVLLLLLLVGCLMKNDTTEQSTHSITIDALPAMISCGDLSFSMPDVSFVEDESAEGDGWYVIVTFNCSSLSEDEINQLFFDKGDGYTTKMDINVYESGADGSALTDVGYRTGNGFVYFVYHTDSSISKISAQIISAPDGSLLADSTAYYYYRLELPDDEEYTPSVKAVEALELILADSAAEKERALSQWTVEHFVDEFGDETDSRYLRSKKITGYFSNTATSKSTLDVYVYYEKGDYIRFRLLEYGSHRATHLSSDKIMLAFKVNDETHYMNLKGSSDLSSDVYTSARMNDYDADDFAVLKSALISGETFPCYITIGNSSEYHFSIDGTGFSSALSELETD